MKILIDNREPKRLKRYAEKEGFITRVTELKIGDLIIQSKGICVERKSVFDFVSSYRKGHIQKQLLQMQDNFPHNYLVIVGDVRDVFRSRHTRMTVNQWVGMLSSTLVRYDVDLIQVKNDKRLIRLCESLNRKIGDGKHVDLENTELLKNSLDTDDLRLKLVTCFDQIGLKRGKKKLENSEVLSAVDELIRVMN